MTMVVAAKVNVTDFWEKFGWRGSQTSLVQPRRCSDLKRFRQRREPENEERSVASGDSMILLGARINQSRHPQEERDSFL